MGAVTVTNVVPDGNESLSVTLLAVMVGNQFRSTQQTQVLLDKGEAGEALEKSVLTVENALRRAFIVNRNIRMSTTVADDTAMTSPPPVGALPQSRDGR